MASKKKEKKNSLGFVIIYIYIYIKENGKLYTMKSNAMGGLKWMLKEVFFLYLTEKEKSQCSKSKQEAACHRMNYTHCLTRSSKQKI